MKCSGLRYVAIKIISSRASNASREVQINRRILDADNSARRHVVTLLDSFQHVGPNGVHDCLVFEPMGPDVASCLHDPVPYREARSICEQLLMALQCLHDLGIVHADTNPGNLLVSLEHPIEGLSVGGNSALVRVDGTHGRCTPQRIYEDRPLTDFCERNASIKFKLSDLGAGT